MSSGFGSRLKQQVALQQVCLFFKLARLFELAHFCALGEYKRVFVNSRVSAPCLAALAETRAFKKTCLRVRFCACSTKCRNQHGARSQDDENVGVGQNIQRHRPVCGSSSAALQSSKNALERLLPAIRAAVRKKIVYEVIRRRPPRQSTLLSRNLSLDVLVLDGQPPKGRVGATFTELRGPHNPRGGISRVILAGNINNKAKAKCRKRKS